MATTRLKNRLSASSISRYLMCAKSWQYHYHDKLRPTVIHGALLFGDALDQALNVVLLKQDKSPEETFETAFTKQIVNGKEEFLPTNPNLVYANSDYDPDLLTEADYKYVEKKIEEGLINRYTNYLEVYKVLSFKKKSEGFDSFTVKEKAFYNLMNWLCLRRKGFLMLKVYEKKVMPKIKRVLSVQEEVTLANEIGDGISGKIDLVAEVEGHGVVILDNKTSSIEYEADSVRTSSQLALYLHILEEKYNTRKCGYIVLRKQVVKNRKKVCSSCGYNGTGGRHKTCDNIINGARCGGSWDETIDPDIDIQFIVDEIPEITEALVLQNADDVNTAIKAGVFHRNLNSCKNWYGGRCVYFDKCFNNKETGLVCTKKEGE